VDRFEPAATVRLDLLAANVRHCSGTPSAGTKEERLRFCVRRALESGLLNCRTSRSKIARPNIKLFDQNHAAGGVTLLYRAMNLIGRGRELHATLWAVALPLGASVERKCLAMIARDG
jgi:hypothetical protein